MKSGFSKRSRHKEGYEFLIIKLHGKRGILRAHTIRFSFGGVKKGVRFIYLVCARVISLFNFNGITFGCFRRGRDVGHDTFLPYAFNSVIKYGALKGSRGKTIFAVALSESAAPPF